MQNANDKDINGILEELAKGKDSDFQYWVAMCYLMGYGINENIDEAVKWFTLSAEQEHIDSQYKLACVFDPDFKHYHYYTNKNIHEAIKWYTACANNGHDLAQSRLALCYEMGKGVHQDYNEAIRLYALSSEQGNGGASYNLANLYSSGKDVKLNLKEAIYYLEKAKREAKARGLSSAMKN